MPRKLKGTIMDIMNSKEVTVSESIASEGATKTREAYSAPKLVEFGTIQKITLQAGSLIA
jgi:hypothetical protein